jgi:hypothetical protein
MDFKTYNQLLNESEAINERLRDLYRKQAQGQRTVKKGGKRVEIDILIKESIERHEKVKKSLNDCHNKN